PVNQALVSRVRSRATSLNEMDQHAGELVEDENAPSGGLAQHHEQRARRVVGEGLKAVDRGEFSGGEDVAEDVGAYPEPVVGVLGPPRRGADEEGQQQDSAARRPHAAATPAREQRSRRAVSISSA